MRNKNSKNSSMHPKIAWIQPVRSLYSTGRFTLSRTRGNDRLKHVSQKSLIYAFSSTQPSTSILAPKVATLYTEILFAHNSLSYKA